MICRATLTETQEGSFTPKAARLFFGDREPIAALPFSRSDFFKESARYIKGLSISGVQQKLSLKINSVNEFERVATGGTYILKPSPESFPHAAENEQCAMALSRYAGIETAQSANIPFADGEEAYVTRRYDRVNEQKLHQEDLAQGINLPSKRKYDRSYEEALLRAREMAGGKLSVVQDLFKRVVFAYIIGNDDMHLKNISLIRYQDNDSRFYDRLTPNYDQLLVHAFENHSANRFLALNLLKEEEDGEFSKSYSQYGYYTSADFLVLGQRCGLRKPVVQRIVKNYEEKLPGFLQIIQNSFMPQGMKNCAASVIKQRMEMLLK